MEKSERNWNRKMRRESMWQSCLALPILILGTVAAVWHENAAAQVLLVQPEVQISGRSQSPDSALAFVQDVAVDSRGTVYVLDSRYNAVRIYDAQGAYVRSIKHGARLEELFFVPRAVAVDPSDVLYVLDSGSDRISMFGPSDSAGVTFAGSFSIRFRAWDMCILGSRLFIVGLHEGAVIHELTRDGDLLRSFGEPQEGYNPILGELLASGLLHCANAENKVFLLPRFFGTVRAYSHDGVLEWSTPLPGIVGLKIEEEGGGFGFLPPEDGRFHAGGSVFVTEGQWVVVQHGVNTKGMTERGRYEEVETHLLSLASGQVVGRQADLPLIRTVRSRRAYGVDNVSIPKVTIYSLRIGDEPRR